MLCYVYMNFLAAVFCAMWKRREAKIAFAWDLDTQDNTEPNRPEYEVTRIFYYSRACKLLVT